MKHEPFIQIESILCDIPNGSLVLEQHTDDHQGSNLFTEQFESQTSGKGNWRSILYFPASCFLSTGFWQIRSLSGMVPTVIFLKLPTAVSAESVGISKAEPPSTSEAGICPCTVQTAVQILL